MQTTLPNNEVLVSEYWNGIRDNFSLFVEEIFGFKNEPFHNELDDIISNPNYKKAVIAAPRGSGKSQHVSFAYPLWEIAKNHNLRILIVSNSSMLAASFVSQILDNISRNQKYQYFAKHVDKNGIGVIPKMRDIVKREEKWSSGGFTIDRDDLNIKEFSVQAVGLFGAILSKRIDIIIADDIVNQQNSETEEQRRKVKDWFYTTILPCLIPGGRVIYAGNCWHPDDLISNLLKDPQFDFRKVLRSIITEPTHRDLWQQWADIRLNETLPPETRNKQATDFYGEHKVEMDDGVQVLWPSRFPYSDLFLMRMANSYSFSRMYQCDISENPNQKIKNEWLELAIKKGENLMLQDESRTNLKMSDTTGGLDLAISLKRGSDDTVLITLDRVEYSEGDIRPHDYVIRNITRGKFTPNQVRDLVREKYLAIGHSNIRVESVAYQQAMVNDLEDLGLPVKGYHTGGEKFDPEIGVYKVARLLERGKLVIPYFKGDSHTVDECSRLLNEMRSWPDGHTGDSLMALWFATSEMDEHFVSSYTIPPIEDTLSQEQKTKPREELERQIDLDTMRRGEATRREVKYVPPTRTWDGPDNGEPRHFVF
jgi:hypothetical protein